MLVIHHRVPPWPPPSPTMATCTVFPAPLAAARPQPGWPPRPPGHARRNPADRAEPRDAARRWSGGQKPRRNIISRGFFRWVLGFFRLCLMFFRWFLGFFRWFVGFFLSCFSIISRVSETGNPVWVKSSCFVWICDYCWTVLEFPSRLIWDKGQKLKTPHMMQFCQCFG